MDTTDEGVHSLRDDFSKILGMYPQSAERLCALGNSTNVPHILISGDSGVGKTTLIKAWLCLTYNRQEIVDIVDVLYLCSNKFHYGIGMVRDVVRPFLKWANGSVEQSSLSLAEGVSGSRLLKRLVIDNMEDMSIEGQNALVRMLEANVMRCRCILLCSDVEKINLALQSRCVHIHIPNPSQAIISDYADWMITCNKNLSSSDVWEAARTSQNIGVLKSKVHALLQKKEESAVDNSCTAETLPIFSLDDNIRCLHQKLSERKSLTDHKSDSIYVRDVLQLCHAIPRAISTANECDNLKVIGKLCIVIEIEKCLLQGIMPSTSLLDELHTYTQM